jgi:hypothetical protein
MEFNIICLLCFISFVNRVNMFQEREVAGARGRVDELDGLEDEGGREPGRDDYQRRNFHEEEKEERCQKRV